MKKTVTSNEIMLFGYSVCIFLYTILQADIANSSFIFSAIKATIIIIISMLLILNPILYRNKVAKPSLFSIIFSLILIYLVINNSGNESLIFIVCFTFLLSRCEINDALKKYSQGAFLSFTVTILLAVFGVLSNYVNLKGRWNLGFRYATFGPNLFFSAIVAYVAYKKSNIKYKSIILLMVINIILLLLTKTRSAFLFTTITLLVGVIEKKKDNSKIAKKPIYSIFLSNITFISAFITIGFQLIYNKYYYINAFQTINKLLSFRLTYGKRSFEEFGITLLGQNITWEMDASKGYFYLDSSYLNILFAFGVLTLILAIIEMDSIAKYAVSNNDVYLCLAVVIISLHSVADPQLLSFRYNPFIVLFIPAIRNLAYGNKTKQKYTGNLMYKNRIY